MKNRTPLAALLVGVLSVVGCSSNSQGDDASPVFLSVNFKLLPESWSVGGGAPLQFDSVELRSILKNPGGGTSSFLDTRIEDYVVEWKRLDGGTKVPDPETFGGNVVVPAGGLSSLVNYEFMTRSALLRAPLDQLLPFNGGIDRETGRNEIRCQGTVTFRGRTLSGQPVRGVGIFGMTFLYSTATQAVVGRVN
ncbi:MAG: hypothetical protein IPN83_09215 [Holophagales bacterium]|nr:hypothetical protein [Holophagales bacterium]